MFPISLEKGFGTMPCWRLKVNLLLLYVSKRALDSWAGPGRGGGTAAKRYGTTVKGRLENTATNDD